MKPRYPHRLLIAVLALVLALPLMFTARAQVLAPRPEELRFQALLNEPVATADRHSVVAGVNALLVKDRRSGQCYVAITVGPSVGLAPATCAE